MKHELPNNKELLQAMLANLAKAMKAKKATPAKLSADASQRLENFLASILAKPKQRSSHE